MRAPVPIQTLLVVPIKKVRLVPNGSNVWMYPQSFEQSPCTPFLHSDYNGLGQFFHSVIRRAVQRSPEVAVRGAELRVLAFTGGDGSGGARNAARRGRLRSNPSRRPLVEAHAINNAWDGLLRRRPFD